MLRARGGIAPALGGLWFRQISVKCELMKYTLATFFALLLISLPGHLILQTGQEETNLGTPEIDFSREMVVVVALGARLMAATALSLIALTNGMTGSKSSYASKLQGRLVLTPNQSLSR